MPKIIKNLEEKILDVAEELFTKDSYEKADMRMIAKRVGIAVGTLYNYYPNKQYLFTEVFKKSWKKTFLHLDSIIHDNIDPKEKISLFVLTLYEEIQKRKGMGYDLLKMMTKESIYSEDQALDKQKLEEKKFGLIGKILKEKMKILIMDAKAVGKIYIKDGMEERFAGALILLTWQTLMEYPNEKDKNLLFINQFIDQHTAYKE